jgi:hypothetical protein
MAHIGTAIALVSPHRQDAFALRMCSSNALVALGCGKTTDQASVVLQSMIEKPWAMPMDRSDT